MSTFLLNPKWEVENLRLNLLEGRFIFVLCVEER